MRIGVPKEIKIQEYRVGLTPAGVRELTRHGHTVMVEHAAGLGIGYGDDAYIAAGATIAETAAPIFEAADLIVKVKEPQPTEIARLQDIAVLRSPFVLSLQHQGCRPDDAKGDLFPRSSPPRPIQSL